MHLPPCDSASKTPHAVMALNRVRDASQVADGDSACTSFLAGAVVRMNRRALARNWMKEWIR